MKVFENLTKWQNYTHYVLLAIWVYIWHALPWNELVEQYYLTNSFMGLILLIIWWTIGIFIGDTLIHFIFAILPEPLRWED